ncbi:MAG: hypothetical protein GY948_15500 [Alphaproteobacteria bacterium]|nr:hypothetical protein [Alphaproteobacteria bacterium]
MLQQQRHCRFCNWRSFSILIRWRKMYTAGIAGGVLARLAGTVIAGLVADIMMIRMKSLIMTMDATMMVAPQL